MYYLAIALDLRIIHAAWHNSYMRALLSRLRWSSLFVIASRHLLCVLNGTMVGYGCPSKSVCTAYHELLVWVIPISPPLTLVSYSQIWPRLDTQFENCMTDTSSISRNFHTSLETAKCSNSVVCFPMSDLTNSCKTCFVFCTFCAKLGSAINSSSNLFTFV